MLSMSMTRNRQADREQKIHNTAVRRALERKAQREFDKSHPSQNEVLTEEEEITDEEPKKKEFFDVCNETSKGEHF